MHNLLVRLESALDALDDLTAALERFDRAVSALRAELINLKLKEEK